PGDARDRPRNPPAAWPHSSVVPPLCINNSASDHLCTPLTMRGADNSGRLTAPRRLTQSLRCCGAANRGQARAPSAAESLGLYPICAAVNSAQGCPAVGGAFDSIRLLKWDQSIPLL